MTTTLSCALEWRDKVGNSEWGKSRWRDIVKGGQLTKYRSKDFGVNVYLVQIERQEIGLSASFCVHWRIEDGRSRTRFFSPAKFGNLYTAEIAANIFAAYKRAKLTNGELNVPTEWFI